MLIIKGNDVEIATKPSVILHIRRSSSSWGEWHLCYGGLRA